MKKTLLLLLDSVGIGALPDAERYGDAGCATVPHLLDRFPNLQIPNLRKLGLCSLPGMERFSDGTKPEGCAVRCASISKGKDSVVGHWELMGVPTEIPFQTYPDGFPAALTDAFLQETGIPEILGNCVASGTEIIARLGAAHLQTGYPILYTSADSVFQIAAHEDIVPVETLYRWCEAARALFDREKIGIARVIARPFNGAPGSFVRTVRRHDYAALPPHTTDIERLAANGIPVHSVGKPYDIFVGRGFASHIKTESNADGIVKTCDVLSDKDGLVFTNLVDFDQQWGHRRNAEAYAAGLEEVDRAIPQLKQALGPDGMLIVTADHGCDPTWAGTDHTREYIPALFWAPGFSAAVTGTRTTFADVGATILARYGLPAPAVGTAIF